jgi:hypothetical protein
MIATSVSCVTGNIDTHYECYTKTDGPHKDYSSLPVVHTVRLAWFCTEIVGTYNTELFLSQYTKTRIKKKISDGFSWKWSTRVKITEERQSQYITTTTSILVCFNIISHFLHAYYISPSFNWQLQLQQTTAAIQCINPLALEFSFKFYHILYIKCE